jgi:hypothetical protein
VEQADVRGGENVGGFVGSSMSFTDTASSSNARFHNTYAEGSVEGHTNVGGFIGLHQHGKRGSIYNSYAATYVSVTGGGAGENIGAFSGFQATGNREGRFEGTNYFDSTRAGSLADRPVGSVSGFPPNAVAPRLQGRPTSIMASPPAGNYLPGHFTRQLTDPNHVYSGWNFVNIWEEPPRRREDALTMYTRSSA